ncbi:peptidoglycan-binding protein [Roseibium sp. MMSF_3544]|uniref:peptidoglycan-binding domain-containing protein n=1 Tax=unclassified Roseibium TaxID=2629323 RepID=UPI0027401FA2|nr:peptidoglycan-binding protein [Roseibium sp. MMSF_3544]
MLPIKSSELNSVPEILQISMSNPLKKGRQGVDVCAMQTCLAKLGYDMAHSRKPSGELDGVFGDKTHATVEEFQIHQKIEKDGLVGPTTIGRIDDDVVSLPRPSRSKLESAFNVIGTPAPTALADKVIWRPSVFVQAVFNQLEKLFADGFVPRAVLAHLKKTVTIRPEAHATEHQAHHQLLTIFYTPGKYTPGDRFYTEPTFEAQNVLLHEIVHAMRHSNHFNGADNETQGLTRVVYPPWKKGTAQENHPQFNIFFKDRGEFNAITITNTYRSEMRPIPLENRMHRGYPFLRKDHGSSFKYQTLPNPEAFHKAAVFKSYLRKLWREQPGLCKMIASSKAPFNPIRDVSRT